MCTVKFIKVYNLTSFTVPVKSNLDLIYNRTPRYVKVILLIQVHVQSILLIIIECTKNQIHEIFAFISYIRVNAILNLNFI